ncbi:MAG: cytochrome c [Verrucomicrobiales bacterium]|nr:cytochrome c [Verrucomicrobiales bacterium]MCP5525580.1 cytochrome c [Verrucomicrobiales bacterium]
MRYFLAGFALLVVLVVSVAGFRGGLSRKPPIEIFPDMDRQAKVRPQTADGFFANGLGSRLPVAGTVARGAPFADTPLNTGREPGTTNYVAAMPVAVSAEMLARGQERYTIHCSPCHGGQGDAKGITTKFGMAVIGNLHDARIVQLADGELFNTITNGKNLMQGYGPNIDIADRWAIIAYVRALQLSRLATLDEVPAELRASLTK